MDLGETYFLLQTNSLTQKREGGGGEHRRSGREQSQLGLKLYYIQNLNLEACLEH